MLSTGASAVPPGPNPAAGQSLFAIRPLVARFAPSPTGRLHLGHAYSVLRNLELARRCGGRCELRIEDLDMGRCRPEYTAALLEDLAWLGVPYPTNVLWQSRRLDAYAEAIESLAARGLVYRCFRKHPDVADAGSAPHGPRRRRYESVPLQKLEERDNLARGEAFAWRLSADAAVGELGGRVLRYLELTGERLVIRRVQIDAFANVVLGRRDTGTSYHLASVVDDAAQGVTCVLRGSELREVAGLHALLHHLLGTTPPVFGHHTLVTDATGDRLSKRRHSTSLAGLRELGVSADDIRAWVDGRRQGLHPALDRFRCSDHQP